jgi:outer membrane protein OmpA-like peptidoglycan-associated protein
MARLGGGPGSGVTTARMKEEALAQARRTLSPSTMESRQGGLKIAVLALEGRTPVVSQALAMALVARLAESPVQIFDTDTAEVRLAQLGMGDSRASDDPTKLAQRAVALGLDGVMAVEAAEVRAAPDTDSGPDHVAARVLWVPVAGQSQEFKVETPGKRLFYPARGGVPTLVVQAADSLADRARGWLAEVQPRVPAAAATQDLGSESPADSDATAEPEGMAALMEARSVPSLDPVARRSKESGSGDSTALGVPVEAVPLAGPAREKEVGIVVKNPGVLRLLSEQQATDVAYVGDGDDVIADEDEGEDEDITIETAPEPVPVPAGARPAVNCVTPLSGGVAGSAVWIVFHKFGHPTVVDEGENVLGQAIRAAVSWPEAQIQVTGHTDSVGDPTFNRTLALDRAAMVRTTLIDAGIPEARIVTTSAGEGDPLCSNETPIGRANNRRSEILLLAPEGRTP